MRRDDWSALVTFAAIAEAGSLTKAAAALGVSPSALSHAMRSMEARLGVRLLNRSTRSIAPTEAGERLLARLQPAMAEVRGALADLDADRERPCGRLRISAHRTAATHAIVPYIARFTAAYPEVEIELVVDDGLVDIVAGRFDAGVRHAHILDQDMISVPIGGPQRVAVVASPVYFVAHPAPVVEPGDLHGHRCLNYRYTSSGLIHRWQFGRGSRNVTIDAPGGFVTNDVDILLEAALDGAGIACLSASQAARHLASGALVEILADWSPSIPGNYLYYPNRRHVSSALRAFIDTIRYRGI